MILLLLLFFHNLKKIELIDDVIRKFAFFFFKNCGYFNRFLSSITNQYKKGEKRMKNEKRKREKGKRKITALFLKTPHTVIYIYLFIY